VSQKIDIVANETKKNSETLRENTASTINVGEVTNKLVETLIEVIKNK
jgi:hypothetical protein